jgi:hypothetical protein
MTNKRQFTNEERTSRAFDRLATILAELWEEDQTAHSKLFETLIPDAYSAPLAIWRDESYKMFDAGKTVGDVSIFIAQKSGTFLDSKYGQSDGNQKKPIKRKFSEEERVRRAFDRLATVLAGLWEENHDAHTRVFETIIPDAFVIAGHSKDGTDWREHAVPCAVLRNESYKMFADGKTVAEVSEFLRQNLKIYLISKKEQEKLDNELGLKDTMPNGWKRGDDHFARLVLANVKLREA